MHPDENIRAFVAVDLTPPVCAALLEVCRELAASRADVRWVRPGGLHLTLRFLGAVRRSRLIRAQEGLRRALADQPGLRVEVCGLGAFPSLRRPRVLWAGVRGPGLHGLADRVATALEEFGFEREKRAFQPHVTLGRVRSMRGWDRLEAMIKPHLGVNLGQSDVDAVVIYRSTLRADGAVYEPLSTIPLRERREGDEDGY